MNASQAATRALVETERLTLRELGFGDAGFIVELLNDPAFLRYIGDKGVRTRVDACRYLATGPLESYQRLGYGLYRVEAQSDRSALGICGLLKREWLEAPDIGFAFLPAYRSRGYAFESASATMAHARDSLGLKRLLAITSADNAASIRLLGRLGFAANRTAQPPDEGAPVRVFAADL